MTPRVGELTRKGAPADSFFSCRAVVAVAAPQLPRISPSDRTDRPSVALGGQLAHLMQEIQSVTERATQFLSTHPQEMLEARLHSGRWSVAESFDHLARTTQVFLPSITAAIATAPRLAGNRRLRPGTVASLLMRSLEPPYRLKHKIPASLAPQHQDFPSAWGAFLNSQAHLLLAVQAAARLAIDEVKIKSPVCARVSYNAYGALGILAAHERRHLWQASQTLKALDRHAA